MRPLERASDDLVDRLELVEVESTRLHRELDRSRSELLAMMTSESVCREDALQAFREEVQAKVHLAGEVAAASVADARTALRAELARAQVGFVFIYFCNRVSFLQQIRGALRLYSQVLGALTWSQSNRQMLGCTFNRTVKADVMRRRVNRDLMIGHLLYLTNVVFLSHMTTRQRFSCEVYPTHQTPALPPLEASVCSYPRSSGGDCVFICHATSSTQTQNAVLVVRASAEVPVVT